MVLGKCAIPLKDHVSLFGENDRSSVHTQLTNAGSNDYCESQGECKESRNLLDDRIRDVERDSTGIKNLLSGKEHIKKSVNGWMNPYASKFRRLVTKDGMVDVKYVNIPGTSSPYVRDLFHTLMDAKWRYIIFLFTLSFFLSWLVFGSSWYAMVKYRSNETNCIDNVDNWIDAFLFSIEIQTTIGFGGRAVTSHCPEGIILLVVQTIVGMFINCALLGLLFAKLARPKNRGKAIMFSKKAVITMREGHYCLIFRYVDLRPHRLLDSNMRLAMVRPKLTEEGEFTPLDMVDLRITVDYQQIEYSLRLFPLFPVTIIHVIDELSPMYKMSKSQLTQSDFEIIAILEGTVPTTGSTTQAITSYRPNEIIWGHRFNPVFHGLRIGETINRIDLSTLNQTFKEDHTPDLSAFEYQHQDDDKSLPGSYGYLSGSRSNYSLDYRALSSIDWEIEQSIHKKMKDSIISINNAENEEQLHQ